MLLAHSGNSLYTANVCFLGQNGHDDLLGARRLPPRPAESVALTGANPFNALRFPFSFFAERQHLPEH
jgi:hypothetical protein